MSGCHGTLKERFERFIDRTPGLGPRGDCWFWTGGVKPNGYGTMGRGGAGAGNEYAHRVAFLFKEGRLPAEGMEACHTCDVRHCVNPDHIWEGTRKDNLADMTAKGRRVSIFPLPGESHPRHKLTAQQVRAIRQSSGDTQGCADHYGVSKSLIHQIRRGDIWKCLQNCAFPREHNRRTKTK